MKISVVDAASYQPVSLRQSYIRSDAILLFTLPFLVFPIIGFVAEIGWFVTLAYVPVILDFVAGLVSENNQTLHDKLAKTLVINNQ